MKLGFIYCCIFLFVSCEIEGVTVSTNNFDEDTSGQTLDSIKLLVTDTNTNANSNKNKKIDSSFIETKYFDNGLTITWFVKGKGEKISKSDMILIDYRNSLEDGTIYDGNHLINKPYIPFFVGWNLQTSGWDMAVQELHVGDEVEIFIPSDLARGEKGIPGIVPPNSPNILLLKVIKKLEPDFNDDGILIWKVEKAKKDTIPVTKESTVDIHYWVSSESKPRYDNSYKRNAPFNLKIGDGNIVPGLEKALLKGKKGDKMMVFIPSKYAFGSQGLMDLVKPNESIFYDLLIWQVR